jgi:hypothetical protein
MTQYTSKVTVSGCFTLPGQLPPAASRCHAPCSEPCMLHAAAAGGPAGMMPASSIAAACQYSCTVQYSTVQLYSTRPVRGHRSSSAWPARAAAALLLLLRCASRPAARLGIRSYSRTALLKSHRRAFTTTH